MLIGMGNKSSNGLYIKKKLFIGSGKPFNFTEYVQNNEGNRERWNKGFQSQLLHETFSIAYTLYLGENEEVYALCPKVVCVVLKKTNLGCFHRTAHRIDLLKLFICARKLHKRQNFCSLETFFPGDGLFISYCISKILKIPLIAQCQGDYDLSSFDDSGKEKSLLQIFNTILDKLMFSIFLKQSNLVLGYNDHCASFAICNGAHPKKVRRVRIQSFIEEFQKIEPVELELLNTLNGKKIIFLWSRLSREKKLLRALDALEIVLKTSKDICLLIAGSGPLDLQIKDQFNELKDQVFFLGHIDRKYIKSYILRANANIVPLGGHALVDAGLCNKPVVAFNLEWHTEVITDKESGILVDYPNVKDFVKGIIYLLNEPESSKKMGVKFGKRIRFLFDKKKVTQREIDVFNEFHRVHQK